MLQAEGRCRFFKWQDQLDNNSAPPQQPHHQPATHVQRLQAGNRLANTPQGIPAAAAGGSGVFADEGKLLLGFYAQPQLHDVGSVSDAITAHTTMLYGLQSIQAHLQRLTSAAQMQMQEMVLMTTLGLEMVATQMSGQVHTTATLLHPTTRTRSRALEGPPRHQGLLSLLRSSIAAVACSAPISWLRLPRMMGGGSIGQ